VSIIPLYNINAIGGCSKINGDLVVCHGGTVGVIEKEEKLVWWLVLDFGLRTGTFRVTSNITATVNEYFLVVTR
jgi:hypothetical protein